MLYALKIYVTVSSSSSTSSSSSSSSFFFFFFSVSVPSAHISSVRCEILGFTRLFPNNKSEKKKKTTEKQIPRVIAEWFYRTKLIKRTYTHTHTHMRARARKKRRKKRKNVLSTMYTIRSTCNKLNSTPLRLYRQFHWKTEELTHRLYVIHKIQCLFASWEITVDIGSLSPIIHGFAQTQLLKILPLLHFGHSLWILVFHKKMITHRHFDILSHSRIVEKKQQHNCSNSFRNKSLLVHITYFWEESVIDGDISEPAICCSHHQTYSF